MSSQLRNKPLLVAFITMLLDLLGFGIIIPISAFYAESLGATPTQVTLLGASYSLMQFLFAPLWGRLSDRYGRRPIILGSVCVTAVGYALFAMSSSLPMLFFARMLSGFGAANIATVQAIVSDVTTPETRARGMGMIGAAFGLGFILGPAIGGATSKLGHSAPPAVAAVLCLLNLVFAWTFLKETLKPGEVDNSHRRSFFSFAAFRRACQQSNVGQILIMQLLFYTGFAMMEQIVSLFIEGSLKTHALWDPSTGYQTAAKLTAWFLVSAGVVSTIIQGGLIGRLTKKYGERQLLIVGLCIGALGMFLIPLLVESVSLPLILGSGAIIAMGNALYGPSVSSLLTRSADQGSQGGTLGMQQSMAALGRIFGPAMSGIFFEIRASLPFVASCLLLASCLPLALKTKQPAKN